MIALSDVVYMAESAYLVRSARRRSGSSRPTAVRSRWPLHTSLLLAKEYAFTGDRITAARAAEIGLANHVCPDDEVLAGRARRARDKIAKLPRQAVEATKRVLNLHLERAVLATIDFAMAVGDRVVRHARAPRQRRPLLGRSDGVLIQLELDLN